ncbi:hypothetical protein DUT91_13445 [Phyllobacterium salinisoli]|uniref:DUF5330 domain-containing protein n=1 Tax=Phyllobacterium salinisoli TaxID=1899321 RepID=A0A368K1N2_9HYPH|nr:DUF5330 domain-containing protein [Phyllobacterium salinisoli]RCS23297.1 hypothetical protein DUT91_13445 [Phyllobacterium salinisoli]
MRFLIKTAFWLTLAFLVLPHTPLAKLAVGTDKAERAEQAAVTPAVAVGDSAAHKIPSGDGETKTGPLEAFFAAGKTVDELGSFCTRNASICETGKAVLSSLGMQAKDGARLAQEYLAQEYLAQEYQDVMPGGKPAAKAVSSAIKNIQTKIPETLKNAESISIPVPVSRQTAIGKTDGVHTGTVKQKN